MDINEVFDEMIGKDEEGCPKSYLSLVHNLYIKRSEEVQVCNEYETTSAELIAERLDSLTQIKLKFDRAALNDLKIFWNIIHSCVDEIAAAPVDDVNNFHFLTLTIIPKTYNGSQFAVASNPLFVNLVSNTPNDDADTISMVFNSDAVVFYETSEIDSEQIEKEVEGELAEEERLETLAELKRQEKEEYQERRNRLIQERRNFY